MTPSTPLSDGELGTRKLTHLAQGHIADEQKSQDSSAGSLALQTTLVTRQTRKGWEMLDHLRVIIASVHERSCGTHDREDTTSGVKEIQGEGFAGSSAFPLCRGPNSHVQSID